MTTAIATLPVDVTANIDGLQQGMQAAARQVESSAAQMNRAVATVARAGAAFDKLEAGTKALSRSASDARGALELLGSRGVTVASSLSPIASTIGNIADAFGSLSTVMRAGAQGAGGLSLATIGPVLGGVVTAATAAYGAFQLFAGSAKAVEQSQAGLQGSLRLTAEFFDTVEASARRAGEAQRQAAIDAAQAALQVQREQLDAANAESDRLRRIAGSSRSQAMPEPGNSSIVQQDVRRDLEALAERAQRASDNIARLEDDLRRLQSVRTLSGEPFGPPVPEQRRGGAAAAANALEDSLNRLAAAAGQVRIPTEHLDEARRVLEATQTPAEKYAATLTQLNELAGSGAIGAETYARAVAQAQQSFRGADAAARRLEQAGSAVAMTFSSAFEDAIIRGRELRDVLQGVLQDIARLIVRQTITNPLANAASSLLTSVVGSVFGGSGAATPAVAGGGSLTFGGPRATGGPVASGNAYIVGETGPEWFVPSRPGVVLPHGLGPRGSSGVTNNIVVDARHSRLSASEIRAIINGAVAESKLAIADGARRGGGFAATVRGR